MANREILSSKRTRIILIKLMDTSIDRQRYALFPLFVLKFYLSRIFLTKKKKVTLNQNMSYNVN